VCRQGARTTSGARDSTSTRAKANDTRKWRGQRHDRDDQGRDTDTHDRVRYDRVDKSGTVTPRDAGQLRHIGVGRTHSRTHVLLLVQDLQVGVVNAITGELLRELTIDTNKDYQPRK
jgi:hypothetical protein